MGGVLVETAQGMIDNTTDSRWQEVEHLLSQMALVEIVEEPVHQQEMQQDQMFDPMAGAQQPEGFVDETDMPMGMPDTMINQDETL